MEIYDKYIHELILLNPTMNDFIKDKKYNHLRNKMSNFLSKEYENKEKKLNKKYLNQIQKKDNLNLYEKLMLRDLKDYFKTLYFDDKCFPLSHSNNLFIDFITVINSKDSGYEFTDIQSYKDFISRMKKCKSICNDMIANMKKGIKNKMTIDKIIVQSIITQLQEILINNNYENEFNHYRKIPSKIKKEFLDCIEKNLVFSIKKINQFLIDDYIDHCNCNIGLCSHKNGKKLYRDIVNSYIKDYTPEMIHKLGLNEVSIVKQKILDLLKKKKFKGDYNEFIIHMKNNPSSKMKDKTQILNEIKKLRESQIKEIFNKYFDDKIQKKDYYNIKCVPEEDKYYSAYYELPELNSKKNGTYYINALNPSIINKHELPVLTLHEGIPGHHYENKKTMSKDRPLYYKLSDFTSYSEGWGFYCESLLKPKNDYEYFWQLIYNLHRCVRLVVDTGIHYYGWSYEKTFNYMKKYLPLDDQVIKNEIYRYICDPGQAITYKIGEKFILDLRRKYFKKYGENYKEFHKLFLKIGPLPLDLFEEEFNNYL
jgi:uncharacterized protein (DUF885 family)